MTKRQIPHGPEDLNCPLHKLSMDQVCHTCPWWTQIWGKNPQSEALIDRWDCAVAHLPVLLIENSQRQMQTAASVDKVATEVRATDDAARVAMVNLLNKALAVPRQIANGNGAQPLMIEQD